MFTTAAAAADHHFMTGAAIQDQLLQLAALAVVVQADTFLEILATKEILQIG